MRLGIMLGLLLAGAPGPRVVSTSLVPPILTATLDSPVNPASVNATSVVLTRGAGIPVTPASVSAAGNVITVDLTGVPLPPDVYELRLRGTSNAPTSHAGLYAYWGLDEGAGGSTSDASGNGRNGTLAGGAAWTGGYLGTSALSLNPGAQHAAVNAGTLAPPWTAAMWVRRTDSPGIESCLLDCDATENTGTSLRLEQFSPANRVGYTRYNIADYAFNYIAPVGQWVHLTFLGEAAGVSLYVNGAFQDSQNVPITLFVGYLGGHKASSMQGALDEVQIYGRALSTLEIAALAASGGGVRGPNGDLLDGDGDGTSGGDFTATFVVPGATTDLQVGGCGLSGLELLLLLLLLRRKRAVGFGIAFLLAAPAWAQDVEPVPAAPPPLEEPCAGAFLAGRVGLWRHDTFEALTPVGRREIERQSLGLGGLDLGWRTHQLQAWLSFDYAAGDEVSLAAWGAHAGWRERLPTGEDLPLWATLSAGLIGGRLEVDASGFGDFDPAVGAQARLDLSGRIGSGVGVSVWADLRHLTFDYDETVLSGDDEAVGASFALGGALTLRF